MRAAGHPFEVLTEAELETVHRNVLRVVAEVGLQVEHAGLLERLAAAGGWVDRERQRVRYTADQVEEFIATSQCDPNGWPVGVSGSANLYYGHYLDPVTDEFLPLTVERARAYFQVARALSHVKGCGILGCPLEGIPSALEPLYERYWAWRLGAHPGGSIHRVELCPALLEMYQVHAEAAGRPVGELFHATVYLVPALRLGYQEAEQVAWFLERGLRVGIGTSMVTGGASGPATLAGMVTLAVAEGLLLGLVNRALFGERRWGIWMSATAMDFRTTMRPYGRPDMVLANLIGAQLARRYGTQFGGHCGLTDAPRPSPQAAAQKMQSALATLLAGGRAHIEAGLLGVDEVFSPVQMALDNELISALEQFAREYEVSDEAIGADVIAAVGPGGTYLAEEHTARWFRREMWQPMLWERYPFAAWQRLDGRTDTERAREQVLAILGEAPPPDGLSEDEERALRGIIERAARRSS